jgi:3-dehydroquinate synthase
MRSRRSVSASCRIKAHVVSATTRIRTCAASLNFGHTVGHALEAVTKYKQFRHGEAIGYGMLAALAIGVAPRRDAEVALRRSRGVDHTARAVAAGRRHLGQRGLRGRIGRDKKIVDGTLHFIAALGSREDGGAGPT